MKILDADGYTVHWWINDGIIGRMVDNDGIINWYIIYQIDTFWSMVLWI